MSFVFELATSSTMSKLGELTQARDRQLQTVLDKSGSFNFSLPLDDTMAGIVSEVSTCAVIKLNGTAIWSGPVWTVEETTPNSLQIGCVGWFQTLEKRISKPSWVSPSGPLVYTSVDAGFIAHDLLNKTNNDTSISPTYMTVGTRDTTQIRTRTYQPYVNILDEIYSLSQIESGYDFYVDPTTRALNIYSKLQTAHSDILFEYSGNTISVSRNTDSSKMCNRMIAYGPGGTAQADDQVSQAKYGLFEEAVSLSDVTDIEILQAYANGEVAVRSRPLPMHSFTPRESSSSFPSDPLIFKDFTVGDIVYLKAAKGRMQIPKQAVRIFGATIDFSDNGAAKISSLQTTAV